MMYYQQSDASHERMRNFKQIPLSEGRNPNHHPDHRGFSEELLDLNSNPHNQLHQVTTLLIRDLSYECTCAIDQTLSLVFENLEEWLSSSFSENEGNSHLMSISYQKSDSEQCAVTHGLHEGLRICERSPLSVWSKSKTQTGSSGRISRAVAASDKISSPAVTVSFHGARNLLTVVTCQVSWSPWLLHILSYLAVQGRLFVSDKQHLQATSIRTIFFSSLF